jgi:predicted MFS family arabinose efflux permease
LCLATSSSLGFLLVPTIATELGVSVAAAQWILTVNLLVGAVATPVMGRLADGPRTFRLLMISLAVVLVGSIVAATAASFPMLLAGRALQGLSYGIVPVTTAIARRRLEGALMRRTISSISVTVSIGLGIGYPLTGVIAGTTSFRWAFWFAAAFVASTLVVVLRTVPRGADASAPRRPFDLCGAALLAGGLTLLLLGIMQGPSWGWGAAPTVGCFVGAVVLLVLWVRIELRREHPLIDLRVMTVPDVLLANATAIGLGTAMYIGSTVVAIIAQAPAETGYGLGIPLLFAGFVMLPMSIGSLVASRLVRLLGGRLPTIWLLPIGAAAVAASTALIWGAREQLWEVALGMGLLGIGLGASYAAMPTLIARQVVAHELGSAVSFNQVLRTVGGSLGAAVSGAVLAANSVAGVPTPAGIGGALAVGLVCSVLVLAALLAASVRRRSSGGTT